MNEGSTHPQLSELCPKHLWMFDCYRNKFPRNALQCQSSLHCSAGHQPTIYNHCSINKLVHRQRERKNIGRWQQWATQRKASKVSKSKWGGSHGNIAMGEDSTLTATVTLRLLTREVEVYLKGSYDPKSNSWGGWKKTQQQNIIATTSKQQLAKWQNKLGIFGVEMLQVKIIFR